MIKIICYGNTQKFTSRKKAIEFYTLALFGSEGSESERYINVLSDLYEGKTVCTDERSDLYDY